VSSVDSSQVVRSTVADSWRWIWRDTLMRVLPMGAAPFVYITIFHLPLSFLGLTLHNVPQQVVLGVVVGVLMAAFAAFYRMFLVGPWFRWPTLNDHLVQGAFYLFINAPVEELFFRGLMLAAVTQWTGWIGWGWLVSTAAYTLYHRLAQRRRRRPRGRRFQPRLPATVGTTLAAGGDDRPRLYDERLPQLG
jgi:membrane protease YdiL (CAAX protease family)